MIKKILSITFIINVFIGFTSCKKDTQINPPLTKSVEVPPPPVLITDNLYPNPCNGTFTIQTNSTDSQTVVMYDVSGRMIFDLTINGNTAIVDNSLTNGVYFLKFTTKTGIISRKLIVQ